MELDEDKISEASYQVCQKCGQEHPPWTNSTPVGTFNRSLYSSESEVKKEISTDISIITTVIDGARLMGIWDTDSLGEMGQALESLSTLANSTSHELFPEKDGLKELITRLEACYNNLSEGELEEIEFDMMKHICTLKLLHCSVYSVGAGKVDDASEKAQEDDDNGPKVEGMEIVGCKPVHEMTLTDIAKAYIFDGRYHHRRANKCMRCAAVKYCNKDCFFSLGFKAIGNALDKCTNCKRSGYRCKPARDSVGNDLVEARFSEAQDSDEKQTPPAAASSIPTLPTPAVIPQTFSASALTAAHSTSQRKRRHISDSLDSSPIFPRSGFVTDKNRNLSKRMRTLVSDSSSESEPPMSRKHGANIMSVNHAVQDKATMLRQVSRLNISFESFTDVSLRQVESDRKRTEQEAALEEHKLAYEESKRLCEERKQSYEESMRVVDEKRRIFSENERLCKESEPVYAQEWLAAKSDSAGEDLIKEATSLLSSITQDPILRDVVPALQRLRSVFADFQRIQGELSETHKFKGNRAQSLYALMDRIHRVVDREVLVADVDEGLSRRR